MSAYLLLVRGGSGLGKPFRGGIRFSETLTAAKKAALKVPLRVFTPTVIRHPLQNGRTVFSPTVSEEAYVCVGDIVAIDPSGAMPPLHSGVSGIVHIDKESRLTPDGNPSPLLSVKSDGLMKAATPLPRLSDTADAATIVQRMYDGGLVGLGGAGFPTFQKYQNKSAHHLLINACECEPYLACDGRLVIEQADTVRDGIRYLIRAGHVPENGVYLCAESEIIAEGLQRMADGTAWRVILLPARYPQGSEKQLIRAVLDIETPPGVYPSDWGILVSNVGTAAAMADAANGLPLTHRAVTVSGMVTKPCNIYAPIGTPFCELVSQAEPHITGRRAQFIAGGAMTGQRLVCADAGLPKTCGGVLVLPVESEKESPCIRCGACVRACPSGLMPYLIDGAWLHHEDEFCTKLRATSCISCGCCSRVCPAQRQLAARITHIRRKGVSR